VLNDNIMPLHWWNFAWVDSEFFPQDYKHKLELLKTMPNFWKTPKGKHLAKILKNCRSQCWDCHECEKTFETPYFDSALQLQFQKK